MVENATLEDRAVSHKLNTDSVRQHLETGVLIDVRNKLAYRLRERDYHYEKPVAWSMAAALMESYLARFGNMSDVRQVIMDDGVDRLVGNILAALPKSGKPYSPELMGIPEKEMPVNYSFRR